MIARYLRLGVAAALLGNAVLLATPLAQAQDQSSLATAANSAMLRTVANLEAALRASSETEAKESVEAGIAAGESAVAALETLVAITTDDVVRSRSEAAATQTQNAINDAKTALSAAGDTFRSRVSGALAEAKEAIGEFAPVLQLVPAAPAELPKAGEGNLTPLALAAIGALGLSLLSAGSLIRRRLQPLA